MEWTQIHLKNKEFVVLKTHLKNMSTKHSVIDIHFLFDAKILQIYWKHFYNLR